MVKPPKLSPFGGADDTDFIAALGKPGCEDAARGDASNPVQSLFLHRMFDIGQLKAVRVQKRFDGLRETYSVLLDVLDFFFDVPFEFHRAEHTIPGRSGTRSTRTEMAKGADLESFKVRSSTTAPRAFGSSSFWA
jgi:hypothetical protein